MHHPDKADTNMTELERKNRTRRIQNIRGAYQTLIDESNQRKETRADGASRMMMKDRHRHRHSLRKTLRKIKAVWPVLRTSASTSVAAASGDRHMATKNYESSDLFS